MRSAASATGGAGGASTGTGLRRHDRSSPAATRRSTKYRSPCITVGRALCGYYRREFMLGFSHAGSVIDLDTARSGPRTNGAPSNVGDPLKEREMSDKRNWGSTVLGWFVVKNDNRPTAPGAVADAPAPE